MGEFVTSLVKHDDIMVHVVGWGITILVACSTLLYKGIWKRINQIDDEHSKTKENLDRLIGAHNATHHNGEIIERRNDPSRPTIVGYIENEKDIT